MSAVVAAGRRVLPRGWRDFGLQIVIWIGFYFGYQLVRSFADQNQTKALLNGFRVIDIEQRVTGRFLEQTAQQIADSSHVLLTAAAWTYWNSEFTVIGLSLLWVYLRRHAWFSRFRNTMLVTNMIGLVGYVLMPTAPPWMFPTYGFVDGVNHQNGLVGAIANPFAAMPSLHAADALIVGVFLFRASRRWWAKALWALWPAWVWFCVMATANHFWLDVVAGILVALIGLSLVSRVTRRRTAAAPA
ncbi:MAG TPA: phosphatase PAP2 family protein [Gaiellaceae bacterium]|nr:phosphatase PAP2 family protein [Gaiellaceae bacterium]